MKRGSSAILHYAAMGNPHTGGGGIQANTEVTVVACVLTMGNGNGAAVDIHLGMKKRGSALCCAGVLFCTKSQPDARNEE
jgi:hypothetical protein